MATKKTIAHYFVMEANTEKTLAITTEKEVVDFFKNQYPKDVIVRIAFW